MKTDPKEAEIQIRMWAAKALHDARDCKCQSAVEAVLTVLEETAFTPVDRPTLLVLSRDRLIAAIYEALRLQYAPPESD